jgi:hypothetical protein
MGSDVTVAPCLRDVLRHLLGDAAGRCVMRRTTVDRLQYGRSALAGGALLGAEWALAWNERDDVGLETVLRLLVTVGREAELALVQLRCEAA